MMRKSLLSLAAVSLLSFASLPAQSASWAPFGMGCPGSGGIPNLDSAGGLPFVAIPFQVSLTNLPSIPGGVYVILGFDHQNWEGLPLPLDLGIFGMFGCTLYQSIDFVFPSFNPGGSTIFILPIPNDPSLAGLVFCLQAAVMDDGAPNPTGMTATNSGRGVIGLGF